MADSLLTTKKNLRGIKNIKKNINSEKKKFDLLIEIWNKKIPGIILRSQNINGEIQVSLFILLGFFF